MKNLLLNLTLFTFLLYTQTSCEKDQVTVETQPQPIKENPIIVNNGEWMRVFTEDFNATGNLNQWQKTNRKDYNSSLCNYVSDNPILTSFESKNCLELSAYSSGSEYKSGHVKSNWTFHPAINEEYYLTASIKLMAKDGSTLKNFSDTYGAWPAFWTVKEEGWPVQGEIDILEGYSFSPQPASFASNIFYGIEAGKNLLGRSAEKKYAVSEGWHTYQLRWKNVNGTVSLQIYVDDVKVSEYTNSINNQLKLENFKDHSIILNLNVGANKDIFDNSKINLFSRTYMYIDYVTVEKRTIKKD